MKFTTACTAFVALGCTFQLQAQKTPGFFSVPPADAPELSHRGGYAVGVRTIDLRNPGQPDILNFDKPTGKAPLYDRPLRIEVWYPAIIPNGSVERTDYEMKLPRVNRDPGGTSQTVSIPGKALRDSPPAEGKPYPLVIVSHGYPGSDIF